MGGMGPMAGMGGMGGMARVPRGGMNEGPIGGMGPMGRMNEGPMGGMGNLEMPTIRDMPQNQPSAGGNRRPPVRE